MVYAKQLLNIEGLTHYFTDKFDRMENSETNGISADQIHAGKAVYADGSVRRYEGTDALVTDRKLSLLIRTADCLPIFLYDPVNNYIAAVHAGWKGLAEQVISNTVQLLISMGSKPETLLAAIGPHIGPCCYNVPDDRVNVFSVLLNRNHRDFACENQNTWFLDLGKIAEYQLLDLGVTNKHIEDLHICTKDHDNYYSYRRGGIPEGRMIHLIGLK